MNPMQIDVTAGRRLAFASSEKDGRDRWTELSVYHVPLLRRPWVAEALGCSNVPGETVKRRVLASASLERALNLFDESDLGVIVKESAREAAEEEGIPARPPQHVPASDRDALAILFGVDAADLSIRAASRALDTGESTVRAAIAADREIRVDRKSTRLNSSHLSVSRMPSSA